MSVPDVVETLWRHAAPYRHRYAVMVVSASVTALAEAGVLYLLAAVATLAVNSGNGRVIDGPLPADVSVGALVAVGLALVVVRTAAAAVTAVLGSRMSAGYERQWKQLLLVGFLEAPWPTQSEVLSGPLQNTITTDVESGRLALEIINRTLISLLSLLMVFLFAVVVQPRAAILLAVAVVLLGLVVRPLSRGVTAVSARFAEVRADQAEQVAQVFSLTREITLFGAAPHFIHRFDARLEAGERLRRRLDLTLSAIGTLYQAVMLGGALAALGVAYQIDPDLLVSLGPVVLLVLRSLGYSQSLNQGVSALRTFEPYIKRVAAARSAFESAARADQGSPISSIGDIELRDVEFEYRPEQPVLRSISLRIDRGELLGIVGPSGGGKSTLVQLLTGLRDPTRGEIFINGMPSTEVLRSSWQRRTAFVAQETVLLNESIADNIRFGRDEVSDEAVRAAAASAGVAAEIERMPEGYATVAGEGGRRLSGGQRQRICIARALAGEPDLLVVDEPTSALDQESERVVRESLAALRGRVTTVVVAHKLTTLDVCDRIALVVDGRIDVVMSPAELQRRIEIAGAAGVLSV